MKRAHLPGDFLSVRNIWYDLVAVSVTKNIDRSSVSISVATLVTIAAATLVSPIVQAIRELVIYYIRDAVECTRRASTLVFFF